VQKHKGYLISKNDGDVGALLGDDVLTTHRLVILFLVQPNLSSINKQNKICNRCNYFIWVAVSECYIVYWSFYHIQTNDHCWFNEKWV